MTHKMFTHFKISLKEIADWIRCKSENQEWLQGFQLSNQLVDTFNEIRTNEQA